MTSNRKRKKQSPQMSEEAKLRARELARLRKRQLYLAIPKKVCGRYGAFFPATEKGGKSGGSSADSDTGTSSSVYAIPAGLPTLGKRR